MGAFGTVFPAYSESWQRKQGLGRPLVRKHAILHSIPQSANPHTPWLLAHERPLGSDRDACSGRSGCAEHFRQAPGNRPRLRE
eukprot:13306045-Alexandrium_andersonii.AAC.1